MLIFANRCIVNSQSYDKIKILYDKYDKISNLMVDLSHINYDDHTIKNVNDIRQDKMTLNEMLQRDILRQSN